MAHNVYGVKVDDWLDEDSLMLLSCWARDGYTYEDVAMKIGISLQTLKNWRKKYPEINEALRKGREIIDYEVENALLKSALGYKTKEVKVTSTMRHGQLVETIREVTHKEQAPNVSAIQCWLYNRLPDKWKKNRDNLIEVGDEDTTIHVTVTRASDDETGTRPVFSALDPSVNTSLEIRNKTAEELAAEHEQHGDGAQTCATKSSAVDLDAWPDDWEDD